MCGIVGQVVNRGLRPDIGAVRAASEALKHRGPDGDGLVEYDRACFGHRRLGVLDPGASTQPWLSNDRRHALVFNGEIYNYLELRRELESAGCCFRTRGDTEVLLAMFVQHGANCLARLNGMFAFAVWDDYEGRLFLARDRIGKKPLYYAVASTGVAFASELSALRVFPGIDWSLDLESAHDFFAYQFIGGEKTIYRGVRKLLPGNCLEYHDGQLTVRRYWKPPVVIEPNRSLASLEDELLGLLEDAVRLRLRSDVPLGVFLSGGLDSALIAGLMRRLGVEIESFTVGFTDESFDERAEAAQTAYHYGTRHREQVVDLRVSEIPDSWLTPFGEPFADPSAIPTWYLSRHARGSVTVALSGDGGDELFGGYRRYQAAQLLRIYEAIPAGLRRQAERWLLSAFPDDSRYYGSSRGRQLREFLRLAERLNEAPNDLLPQTFSLGERRRLFVDELVECRAADHVADHDLGGLDRVSRMMQADVRLSLPEDILTKVDRMSMAHSLEVRSPLLDYRVVEFACSLPLRFKLRHGIQKYLLQRVSRTVVPDFVRSRRKHGFAVPLGRWFRGELRRAFESTVLGEATPSFLRRAEIERLWSEHQAQAAENGFKLWSLYVFHLWYRRWGRT
jgi:asparagine synthase (glutamine-hydrolysing)